jgi:hypothetical protein
MEKVVYRVMFGSETVKGINIAVLLDGTMYRLIEC